MATIYRSSVILRSFSVVSNSAKRDENGFSRFSYSPRIVWFYDSMNKNNNSEHAQNRDTFPFNVQGNEDAGYEGVQYEALSIY